MKQSIEHRIEKLESEQGARDRPAYRTFTVAEWDSMTAEQQADAAEGCKIYVGIGPDSWDHLPPFNHSVIDALLQGETPPGYALGQAEAMTREVFNFAAIERIVKGQHEQHN